LRDGSWKNWANEAVACGCPVTSESGIQNLLQMKELSSTKIDLK